MSRKKLFSLAGIVFLILVAAGITLAVNAAPRLGYCFEAAFDPLRSRLYLVGGSRGLHVFEMAQDGSLRFVATYYEEGYYRNIEIVGDQAYIANSKSGLHIMDIRGEIPVTTWKQSGAKGYGLAIQDNIAYVVANELGLYTFDISDADTPQLLSHFKDLEHAWDIWVQGEYAYIADFTAGLVVMNISDPSNPILAGNVTWHEGETVSEVVTGQGNYAYVAAGSQGLYVIDISEPRAPTVAYHYDPGRFGASEGAAVLGDILYLSNRNRINVFRNGLYTYNISKPSQPNLMSIGPVTDMVEEVTVSGDYAALANTYSGVVLFDIRNGLRVKKISQYPSSMMRLFTLLVGL